MAKIAGLLYARIVGPVHGDALEAHTVAALAHGAKRAVARHVHPGLDLGSAALDRERFDGVEQPIEAPTRARAGLTEPNLTYATPSPASVSAPM